MVATLRVDIVTDAKGTQAALDQTDSKLGKLGNTASKAGAALKLGLAAGAVAAVAIGKQAYDAASAVEQSFGALDSIYGKHAGLVKDLANSAATDVGLAKSQYADLAAVLGSQLQNMGRSQQQAANETENLIKMGADLSATFGGSVADAVNAVSSALKGETDPIERYGASVKQADINARLASQGLDGLTGTAAKQAQATAVLGLITEQTAKTQGAFGREAGTAAGQQARLSANVENLKARLGAGLLPIMATTFEFISTRVIPGASRFAETMSRELGPSISRVGEFVTARLIPAARDIYSWFVEKIVPNIRATVVPIFNQVRATIGGLTKTLDDNSAGLSKVGNFLKRVAEFAADLAPIVGKVVVFSFKTLGFAIESVITVVSTLANWIDTAIGKIKDLANTIANNPIIKGAGKVLGAIPGFSSPVVGQVGRLAGRAAPVSPVGLGQLATAAGGAMGYSGGGFLGGSAMPAIVDARRIYNIDATGAVDPVATAERIRAILRADDIRNGRSTTFAPATGWLG